MTEIFLALAAISALLAFAAGYTSGKKAAAVCILLSAVFLLPALIMQGKTLYGIITAVILSAFAYAIHGSYAKEDKKELIARDIILAAIFILALFFGGCSRIPPYHLAGKAVNVGFVPSDIALTEDNMLAASRQGGTEIFIIEPSSGTIKATYTSGRHVTDMIFSEGYLYTANKMDSNVSVIDLATSASKAIKTDLYTASLALDKEKGILYAANMGESTVCVIDTAAKKVTGKIATGRWPSALYFDKKTGLLYISCKYTNTLEVFDTQKGQMVFTEAHTGISPVAVLPVMNKQLVVLNEWEYAVNGKGRLTVFDAIGYSVSDSIQVAAGITGGIVSKSGRYVYAAIPLEDTVAVIDMKAKAVVSEIHLPGFMPSLCALSRDGSRVYVSGLKANTVEIIFTGGMN